MEILPKKRDYKAETRARNIHAQSLGYKNYYELRKARSLKAHGTTPAVLRRKNKERQGIYGKRLLRSMEQELKANPKAYQAVLRIAGTPSLDNPKYVRGIRIYFQGFIDPQAKDFNTPTNTKKDVIAEQYELFLMQAGLMIWAISRKDGEAIINNAHSASVAMGKYASSRPQVKKALKKLFAATEYTMLIQSHSAILIPILKNHNILPSGDKSKGSEENIEDNIPDLNSTVPFNIFDTDDATKDLELDTSNFLE